MGPLEFPKVNMFNKMPVQQIGAVGTRGTEATKETALFGGQKVGGTDGGFKPNYAQYDYNSPVYEGGMNVGNGHKAGLKLDFMS